MMFASLQQQAPLLLRLTFLVWNGTTREAKGLGFGLGIATGFGVSSLELPVYTLVIMMGWLILFAAALGWFLRPKLRIRGEFPDRVLAGDDAEATLHLTNIGRRTAYDVSAAFARNASATIVRSAVPLPELMPGETKSISTTLRPHRRGLYRWADLRVFSQFPLGLFQFPPKHSPQIEGAPSSLLALPSFHALEHIDVPVNMRYQPGGMALSSHVGESPEYIGNREYRPGDSARHIDFRSWARLAKPVVREYEEEYYCRVALVLDTYVDSRNMPTPKDRSPLVKAIDSLERHIARISRDAYRPRSWTRPPGGYPNMEAAISLSASIADALARSEYILDIFAAGPKLHVFRAGRSMAHFENVLEILACIDECPSNPFDDLAPALQEELANISTVFCIFLDWDEARLNLVRAAMEVGCVVKVILVRDYDFPTTTPLDGAPCPVDRYSPHDVALGNVTEL